MLSSPPRIEFVPYLLVEESGNSPRVTAITVCVDIHTHGFDKRWTIRAYRWARCELCKRLSLGTLIGCPLLQRLPDYSGREDRSTTDPEIGGEETDRSPAGLSLSPLPPYQRWPSFRVSAAIIRFPAPKPGPCLRGYDRTRRTISVISRNQFQAITKCRSFVRDRSSAGKGIRRQTSNRIGYNQNGRRSIKAVVFHCTILV